MSIAINLLPYRQEKRLQLKRNLILGCLSAVGLALLAAVLWFMYYQFITQDYKSRVTQLQEESARMQKKITEIRKINERIEVLKGRESAIGSFQLNRNIPTQLLESLAKITPNGVMLTHVKLDKELKVDLQGISVSNEAISSYMRSIENMGWMKVPTLLQTQSETQYTIGYSDEFKDLYTFGMRFNIIPGGLDSMARPQLTPEGDAIVSGVKSTETSVSVTEQSTSGNVDKPPTVTVTKIEAPNINVHPEQVSAPQLSTGSSMASSVVGAKSPSETNGASGQVRGQPPSGQTSKVPGSAIETAPGVVKGVIN